MESNKEMGLVMIFLKTKLMLAFGKMINWFN